jgi:UPF0755 protein
MAALAALALVGLAAWQVYLSPRSLGVLPPPRQAGSVPAIRHLLKVEEGDGVADVARKLKEAGIIADEAQFRTLAVLLGYQGLLQAGIYELSPGMSSLEVLQAMRYGRFATRKVTVVEGWRLEEIARAVEEAGIASAEAFLAAAVAGPYQDRFPMLRGLDPSSPLEGYLFPATYLFPVGTAVEDVVGTMLGAMAQVLTPELQQEAARKGLTVHQLLTLASIVERETSVAEERPIIAQVFLRRLELGIPLEADPTVQYAVAQLPGSVERYGYWKRSLTLEDLRVSSPYNTYLVVGLPPGPIASPSLDSIWAVVRPSETDYLFFVARPDGTHAFARTWDEHVRNVQRYGQ